MELTSEGIEYLRAVVTAQLLDGGCAGKPHARAKIPHGDRVNTSVPNQSWSYTKQRYRAVFHPQDADGKKRRRQNFYTESMDRAMAFVETGDRGVDTEPPKDVEDRSSPEPSEDADAHEEASSGNDDGETAEIV